MKRYYSLVLLCLFLYPAFAQQKIKVACIGNSITYGAGVKDRNNTYPNQLQKLLGDQYEVMNLGASGKTMLKKGNDPYWKERAFTRAKEFAPDIVIIKLGTNDSKPQNWKYKSEFEADYRAFIQEFKNLPSKPRIWVCYPVPVVKDNFGITDSIVRGEVIPKTKKVAKAEKVKIINLQKALKGYDAHIPDGVHPDDIGAGQIAKTVYKKIHRYKPKR